MQGNSNSSNSLIISPTLLPKVAIILSFLGLFLLAISIVAPAALGNTSESKTLKIPILPASFEVSWNNDRKGCVGFVLDEAGNVDKRKTDLKIGGIAYNEDVLTVGTQSLIQTAKDGVHSFEMMYSPKHDYAYIMANKAQKALCIIEKLTDLSFQKQGQFQATQLGDREYTPNECAFTPHYTELCRTFNNVVEPLISKGFVLDWQGVNRDGHITTSLSGNKKSYTLTTSTETGATVITGVGDEEFTFFRVP